MKSSRSNHLLLSSALVAALTLLPASARACATCFGASDSDLARGASIGIFFLLAVILSVLGSVAAFFVFLARRAGQKGSTPS